MSNGMDDDFVLHARRSDDANGGRDRDDDRGGRGRDDADDDRGGQGRGRDDEGGDDRGGRGRDDDLNGDDKDNRIDGTREDDHIHGRHGRDRLDGDRGDDIVEGGAGNDTLTGGKGDDTFVFNTALGPDNIDHITDFKRGHDVIKLDSDVFIGLEAGVLERSAFKDIKSHDVDADDRILYDGRTGELFFDADGAGGADAVHFATLDHDPSLKARDFLVE